MPDLDHLSMSELRDELEQVESKTPAMRLIVGLNYKHGLTQTEIAKQYGVTRKTVYNWLKRLETGPLSDVIDDDDRPGRPPKLSSEQQRELNRVLQHEPAAIDQQVETWTPSSVRRYIAERFDVAYSIPHVRRLMREAGLRPANTVWTAEEDDSGATD